MTNAFAETSCYVRMSLDLLALQHGTDKSSGHHDYCPTYERHLRALRTQPLVLLEVGVLEGASLRMWADYLTHPASRIIGVDLFPQPADVTFDPRVSWIQLNAMSADMLTLRERLGIPSFDVIIDDGSHYIRDMQDLWLRLWPQVSPGGLYVLEDTCCAYWPDYNEHGTWNLMRWLGYRLDDIHCHGKRAHGLARKFSTIAAHNDLTEHEATLHALHVYNSLVVMEKRR